MAGERRGLAIGIDLGTTYSCVGVWQNGGVEVIANDQGNRTTPSYVAFTGSRLLVGDAAKNQAEMNPSNTIFGGCRLLLSLISSLPKSTPSSQISPSLLTSTTTNLFLLLLELDPWI
jgi:molecular chaperone DnaK (HSP70)